MHNHSNGNELRILMQIKLISLSIVEHQDSLRNRDKQQLGNGPLNRDNKKEQLYALYDQGKRYMRTFARTHTLSKPTCVESEFSGSAVRNALSISFNSWRFVLNLISDFPLPLFSPLIALSPPSPFPVGEEGGGSWVHGSCHGTSLKQGAA